MYHLAILKPKYYKMILDGSKPIESRFSQNKIAPFGRVHIGDIVYLKCTGGMVDTMCVVDKVQYFNLTPEIVEDIRQKYGKQIGTDKPEEWATTLNKKYGTLIWLKDVTKINPIKVNRSCGNAWFVLDGELK